KLYILSENKLPLTENYIVVQNSLNQFDIEKNDEVINTFILIKKGKISKAKKYIKELEAQDHKKHFFCQGLICFFDNEYAIAFEHFKKSENSQYDYLKNTLIANCMIEMNQQGIYSTFNHHEIVKHFQIALDHCNDPKIKEVIKYHLYNYKMRRKNEISE
ncbi:MAG TPA: hypothetical protein PKJ08_02285, partial [Candidatus Cloacimonadota bacterium]|nr:hypothetical protein [Candidatus Cloacimonadota bacterium]